MSFTDIWAYSNNSSWHNQYPEAKGNNQSPININKEDVLECNVLCDINLYFKSSKCILTVKNNTPIIYFTTGSYLEKIIDKKTYSLKMMTLHTPTMHTINGISYDLEIILFFKFQGNLDPKGDNYTKGGYAVSLLFQRSNVFSKSNDFLNSFVFKIPNDTNNMDNNIDVDVGENWSVENLFPEFKSYFFYEGSLPFPPCEEKWTWVVMEEVQPIEPHILDTLKMSFKGNSRTLNSLNNRKVSYNSDITIYNDEGKIEKITEKMAEETITEDITDNKSRLKQNNSGISIEKQLIKVVVTLIIVILVLYASLKMTKIIITTDIINKLLVPGFNNIQTN